MKNRKANRLKGYDYSNDNLYFVTSCVKNMKCCFGDVVLVGTGRDLSVHDADNNSDNNPDNNYDNNLENNPENNFENNPENIPSIYSNKNLDNNSENNTNNSEYIFNNIPDNISNNNANNNYGNIPNINPDDDPVNNPHNENEIEAKMILNEFGIIANNQLEWLQNQYPYIILHSYIVMPNHIHAIIEIDSTVLNSILRHDNPEKIVKIKSLSQIMGAFKSTSSKMIHDAGDNEFSWHRSFHDHIIRDEKSYTNIYNYIENNPNSWNKDKFYNS